MSQAERQPPASSPHFHRPAKNGWRATVAESPMTISFFRARVMATLMRRMSARKPSSPDSLERTS